MKSRQSDFAALREFGKTKHKKAQLQRSSHAPATLDRMKGKIGALGITRLADVTGLDNIGIPVVLAVRPDSRSLVVSQGKGIDLASARVSAIGEAIESHHAERLDFPLFLTRYSEIAPVSHAVDPALLPRVADTCFTPDLRIPWTEAFDIAQEATKLVPLELVHTDFTLPLPPGSGCFAMSSNGLASGGCFSEALVHGIAEVIERDAFALWRASANRSREAIDLGTASHQALTELVDRIDRAGCTLLVEEITSDVGVPVFMATLWGGGGGSLVTSGASGGLGCHPDRSIACLRAIIEAAQSRLTRISGARDDLSEDAFRPLLPEAASPPRAKPFASGPGCQSDVIEDDLQWLLDRLRNAGFGAVLAVDLTRPEIGIPVVRIIIPGLEGPPSASCAPGARALHAMQSNHRLPGS